MGKNTNIENIIIEILEEKKLINQKELIDLIQSKLIEKNIKFGKLKIQKILSKNLNLKWYAYRYKNNSKYFSLSENYESDKVKKIYDTFEEWTKQNEILILASMHHSFYINNTISRNEFEHNSKLILQKIFKKRFAKNSIKYLINYFDGIGWYIQIKKRKESEIVLIEFRSIVNYYSDNIEEQNKILNKYDEYEKQVESSVKTIPFYNL